MADPNGHDPRVFLDLYPQMQEWILGKQEIVRWKNSRSEEIEGIFIKPVNYQAGKSYPVIVDPYPGQVNSFFGSPMYGNQAFASEGYAVFFPNERTPYTWQNPVKDETYNEATRGPTGIQVMMDDLMSGIEALVGRGLIDSERMCLYGFSNGGGAVIQILTETHRFKCAVSASGVATDLAFSFFVTGKKSFDEGQEELELQETLWFRGKRWHEWCCRQMQWLQPPPLRGQLEDHPCSSVACVSCS